MNYNLAWENFDCFLFLGINVMFAEILTYIIVCTHVKGVIFTYMIVYTYLKKGGLTDEIHKFRENGS